MFKIKPFFIFLLIMGLFSLSCKGHKKYATERSVTWYELVSGEKVTHRFKIKNIYSQVIEIGSFYTEFPGSINLSFDKRKLVPGESTGMEMEFDTLGFVGKKTTKVLVYHSNAPYEKPIEFTVNAVIKNYIFTRPQTIANFENITNPANSGTLKSYEIDVLPLKIEEKLNVKKLDFGKYPFFSYEIKDYKNGKRITLHLNSEKLISFIQMDRIKEKQRIMQELTGASRPYQNDFYIVEQHNSKTLFRVPLTIITDHPRQKEIRFVLTGQIYGNINANFPASGIPFTGIMNRLNEGVNFSQDVDFNLFDRMKNPFKIVSIESTNELITVKYEEKNPYEYKIILTFNKDKKLIKSLKLNRGYVLVETNSPYSKILQIPFSFVW